MPCFGLFRAAELDVRPRRSRRVLPSVRHRLSDQRAPHEVGDEGVLQTSADPPVFVCL